jgi:hypothetical protein
MKPIIHLKWYLFMLPIIALSFLSAAVSGQDSIHSVTFHKAASSDLWARVTYYYSGNVTNGKVYLTAIPFDTNGTYYPQYVDYEYKPAVAGTHSLNLRMLRKPSAIDFTTTVVQVCFTANDSLFNCKSVPFLMDWRETPGFCSISGEIRYPRRRDRRDFPISAVILSLDGREVARTRIQDHRYKIQRVPVGKTYTIYTVGSRMQPMEVTCRRRGANYVKNLQIIGGPIDD